MNKDERRIHMAKKPDQDDTPETETDATAPGTEEGETPSEGGDGPTGAEARRDEDAAEATGEDATADETSAEAPSDDADTQDDTPAEHTPETEAERDPEPATEEDRYDEALASAPLVATGAEPEPAPEPEPAGHHHDDDGHHHDEEEHGHSLAARVLTGLILLLVGAGIALWGAPKVAPHLPDGLGPVKAWLMPGAIETEARVDDLEQRMNDRLAALQPGITEEQAQKIAADAAESRVSAAQSELSQRITDLSDQVSAADSGAVEGRLAKLESRVQDLSAQIDSLSGMAGAGDRQGLTDQEREQLSGFQATVEGLRANLADISDKQGQLAQRIDDVEASVQRRLDEANQKVEAAQAEAQQVQSRAQAEAGLTAIEAALSSGEPYEDALAKVDSNTDLVVPEGLSANAGTGVTPLPDLRDSFGDAAHEAIAATVRARGSDGLAGRLASFVESQVATRSLTPQEGNSTDAILSRAEEALRHDNLAAALSELEALDPVAREAMQSWLSRAEARVAAKSGYADLRAAFDAQN